MREKLLQSKSMDWFLYDRDLCHERVKGYRFLLVLLNFGTVTSCRTRNSQKEVRKHIEEAENKIETRRFYFCWTDFSWNRSYFSVKKVILQCFYVLVHWLKYGWTYSWYQFYFDKKSWYIQRWVYIKMCLQLSWRSTCFQKPSEITKNIFCWGFPCGYKKFLSKNISENVFCKNVSFEYMQWALIPFLM